MDASSILATASKSLQDLTSLVDKSGIGSQRDREDLKTINDSLTRFSKSMEGCPEDDAKQVDVNHGLISVDTGLRKVIPHY